MGDFYASETNDYFLNKAAYLDDILATRSKHHSVVRVCPGNTETGLPEFCHVLSPSVLALNDPLANYHKSMRLERLFGEKASNHDLAQHLDYLAYAVAKGENAVIASIGSTCEGRRPSVFGTENDGIAHIVMDHAFQISSRLPGERSLSIRMMEIHNDQYFDLLTDYHKTPLTQETILDKLTEIPVNSVNLVSEWVEQGFNLIDESASGVDPEKYYSDSTIVLYFIIETVLEEKVITSTIMFVDFRDLTSILAHPTDAMCKAMLGEIDGEHPLVSHVFHTDSHKCFIFNVKPELESAPTTLQTLYIAGEFGGIKSWDLAVHVAPEMVKTEIAEYRQKLPILLKDFTGLYQVVRREVDSQTTAKHFEAIGDTIDRVNMKRAGSSFEKKAEMLLNKEQWSKTAENGAVQKHLMQTKYDFKTSKKQSVKEYLDDFSRLKAEKESIPTEIKGISAEFARLSKVAQQYVAKYSIDCALPTLPAEPKAATGAKRAVSPKRRSAARKGSAKKSPKRSSTHKKVSTSPIHAKTAK